MTVSSTQPETAGLRRDLHTLSVRMGRREALRVLMRLCWVLPAAAVIPAVVVRLATAREPVPLLLGGIGVILVGELVWMMVHRLSERSAARHADALLHLEDRLATAVELLARSRRGKLDPLVLAEAADDAAQAARSRWPSLRPAPHILAALAAFGLLIACGFLPRAGLVRWWQAHRRVHELEEASRILATGASRLKQTPALPGNPMTELSLEITDLARRLGAQAVTPNKGRARLYELRRILENTDLARQATQFEADLRELESAEPLRKPVGDARRGDTEAAAQAVRRLQEQMNRGELNQRGIDRMKQVLASFAARTDQPGLAEPAKRALEALPPEGSGQAATSLQELMRTLSDRAGRLQERAQTAALLNSDLERAARVLAGEPAGAPAASQAAGEIFAHAPPSVGVVPGGAPSSPVPSVTTDTSLSAQELMTGNVATDRFARGQIAGGYRRYVQQYFSGEERP